MPTLTKEEKEFLDVFLHEATTSPFTGQATMPLHAIGVKYRDVSWLARAYDREVPMVNFGWGYAADAAPPLPWPDRDAVLERNREIERIWHQLQRPGAAPVP